MKETGLEGLKKFAIERGQKDQHMEELKARKTIECRRLESLPTLCEILRSMARSTGQRHRAINELVRALAPDMKLPNEELKERLIMLSTCAPEFLSIAPADDVVAVETVRINLSAPFADVRRRLQAESTAASKAMKDLNANV